MWTTLRTEQVLLLQQLAAKISETEVRSLIENVSICRVAVISSTISASTGILAAQSGSHS